MINLTGHRKVRIAGELVKTQTFLLLIKGSAVRAPGPGVAPSVAPLRYWLAGRGRAQAHSSVFGARPCPLTRTQQRKQSATDLNARIATAPIDDVPAIACWTVSGKAPFKLVGAVVAIGSIWSAPRFQTTASRSELRLPIDIDEESRHTTLGNDTVKPLKSHPAVVRRGHGGSVGHSPIHITRGWHEHGRTIPRPTMGIDIDKNSPHVAGLDRRGKIVLRHASADDAAPAGSEQLTASRMMFQFDCEQ
jgi:hypothetical protein